MEKIMKNGNSFETWQPKTMLCMI